MWLSMTSRNDQPYLDRVDPRLRVVSAVVICVLAVLADSAPAVAVVLAAGLLGLALSGLSLREAARRLLPLNVVMLLLAVLLPLGRSGPALLEFGPLGFSRTGLELAGMVALKGNAMLLVLLGLLGRLDVSTLGHALAHLRVPEKLIHLLLLTVRYLGVFQAEYRRLRGAMKARAFRPRMDRHTYRTFGFLVGMLLVRSFDRAERVLAAMKCRGFRGRFYLLDHFAFSRADIPFVLASFALLVTVGWLDWIC